MWGIFVFFVLGIVSGRVSGSKNSWFYEKIVNFIVYLLLFLLGINVGKNPLLVSSLSKIGLKSLILALGGIIGSGLFAFFFEKVIFGNKKNTMNSGEGKEEKPHSPFKGSLSVLASFGLGIVSGFFGKGFVANLNHHAVIKYVLFCLLFFVGLSIGADTRAFSFIKKAGKRTIVFPLFTVAGTLAGSLIAVFFTKGITLPESMAVGSGFGYYSLSSVIIAQIKNDNLATIALITNIIREILTLALAPFIVKVFGRFGLISSGGATSMDTTLPVIVRFSGKNYAVISVFHGIVLTILVPIFVSFFASL